MNSFNLSHNPVKLAIIIPFLSLGKQRLREAHVHVARKGGARIYNKQSDSGTWVLHPRSWLR